MGIETYRKQFILGNWFEHFRGLVILNLQDRLQGGDPGRCRIKLDMQAPAGAFFVARSQSCYESRCLIRYLLTGRRALTLQHCNKILDMINLQKEKMYFGSLSS